VDGDFAAGVVEGEGVGKGEDKGKGEQQIPCGDDKPERQKQKGKARRAKQEGQSKKYC
jgi:hypothetical protein